MKVHELEGVLAQQDADVIFEQGESYGSVGSLLHLLCRAPSDAEIEAWSVQGDGIICAMRVRHADGTQQWIDARSKRLR